MFTTSTVYRDGICVQTGSNDWAALAATARGSGDLVWIDVADAGGDDFVGIAAAFDLHHLAVEDAARAERSAKGLEKDGAKAHLVEVLRAAEAELAALHKRLLQRTYFAVPKAQLSL